MEEPMKMSSKACTFPTAICLRMACWIWLGLPAFQVDWAWAAIVEMLAEMPGYDYGCKSHTWQVDFYKLKGSLGDR